MNMQMTPELFLSLPHHPEDDHEDVEPVLYADPLQEVASALNRMADSLSIVARAGIGGSTYTAELTATDFTDPAVMPIGVESPDVELAQAREVELLLAENARLRGQLDEIRAVVKPSVSKLAHAVRAVLDGGEPEAPEPQDPAPAETPGSVEPHEPVAEPVGAQPLSEPEVPAAPQVSPQPTLNTPAPDAHVVEWRAFARSLGYQGPDVDAANRSQIRTMLGLAHPGQVEQ